MRKEIDDYSNLLRLYLELIAELKNIGREDLVKSKVEYAKSAIEAFSQL